MADTKISQLPGGVPAATSLLPVVNGTTTQRVTIQQLLDIVGTVEGPAGVQGDKGDKGDKGDPGLDAVADSHIVAAIEPPPGTEAGQLWIDPSGTLTVTPGSIDVLAAIRGQVIAPKAIDLDGPNTLFITSNPDGTAKLTLRVDGTPLRAITEESVATEQWVLDQLVNRPVEQAFSSTNPPVYATAPVAEQDNGLSIGVSADGMEIHQPEFVGGVPVLVNGKRYLLPLIAAPDTPAVNDATPILTYSDPPATQQLNGDPIGLSADGTMIYQPNMVGGIAVLVGGKRYLLPIIEE